MFNEGVAIFQIVERNKTNPLDTTSYFGYIDQSGKEIMKPLYTYATKFNQGVAAVMYKGKYSIINKKGSIIKATNYDD